MYGLSHVDQVVVNVNFCELSVYSRALSICSEGLVFIKLALEHMVLRLFNGNLVFQALSMQIYSLSFDVAMVSCMYTLFSHCIIQCQVYQAIATHID